MAEEKENKVPKEKVEKPKKVSIEDVFGAIVEMNKNLNAFISLKTSTGPAPDTRKPTAAPVQAPTHTQFPVPPDFREAVDVHLNKKFGIDIEYKQESAAFGFSILVPRDYSDATPSYWDTHGEDRRTKVILNALGTNGVREWCQQVYNAFSPEIRSKITFDRSQPN